ncbi:transcriptional regulator [Streptantibioticus parmotrematis]|uniref:transcriptional regulator n=1 Tax=Streptantibioticus parmotrematis TaxID=2873249 RepID=UPI0033DE1B4A
MGKDVAPQPESPLAELLRTGPFSAALAAAVRASGLTLERIQHRLIRAGTPVSTATLSYWRSGRYQPSQAAALAALNSLEHILDVPPGALSALLGPRRPRARWLQVAVDAPGLSTMWPEPQRGDLEEAYRAVDTRWTSSLRCLSRHMRLELDAHGREHRIWTRQLFRAERDGPDRAIYAHMPDYPGSVPALELRPPCRRGAVFENPRTGVLVAELLFDRPLRRGDTAIFDLTLTHAEPRPYSREFTVHQQWPAGECVLEVCFDPEALPATVHAFGGPIGPGRDARRLLHPTGGSVHVTGTLTEPGDFGVRWEWPG